MNRIQIDIIHALVSFFLSAGLVLTFSVSAILLFINHKINRAHKEALQGHRKNNLSHKRRERNIQGHHTSPNRNNSPHPYGDALSGYALNNGEFRQYSWDFFNRKNGNSYGLIFIEK
jgi:hypothetical protein